MKIPVRACALVGSLALAALALATPSNAQTGPRAADRGHGSVHHLTNAQAKTVHARIRAGTAAASTTRYSSCSANKIRCQYEVLTAKGTTDTLSAFVPFGYGARDLESAYGVRNAPTTHGTIAIIDAGAYPTIESDVGVYRSQYGLSACKKSTGCLRVRNYKGGPERKPATGDFAKLIEDLVGLETALDMDMASAACPGCKLLLLQVPPLDAAPGTTDDVQTAQSHFATAVQTAKTLGAKAVSISYGYPTYDFSTSGSIAAKMNTPGMAISASTGDGGYNSLFPLWPQVLPTVIAAGGTSLSHSSNGTWHEAVWNLAGSGCAFQYAGPAKGQPKSVSANCNGSRASADISAVADPQTGVAVYNTYSPYFNEPLAWVVVGGTSASSPLVAGLYVRAGVPASVNGPNKVYSQPASDFNDIVAGANAPQGVCSADGVKERVCSADVGWDGPTGRGTPKGLRTFR